jgi:carbon storage regulator
MLVLSRRRDESIVIGQGIVVTVVAIKGNQVRIGIDAPREVPVHREEISRSLERKEPPPSVWEAKAPALHASG